MNRTPLLALLLVFVLEDPVSGGGGDTCADAPVTMVPVGPVGSPLTTVISGDNTNATCDGANCPPGTELGWYEAIEIDRCARITIDFCGQDPVLRPSYAVLYQSCPISQDLVIFRDSSSRTEPCTDFNLWMEFNEVPAGRYWFPIYTIPGAKTCENGTPATCNSDADCPIPYTCQDNLHPYTMNVTAEALVDAEASRIPLPEARLRPPSSLMQAGLGGPDIVVSDIFGCLELGREGPLGSGIIGMACGTTACNIGTQSAAWSALPEVNHPLISLNLFRLSTPPGNGGADRFMQVGRSWLKHGYFAENTDECNSGCDPVCEGGSNAGGSCSFDQHCPGGVCQGTIERLAPACADTYVAQQFVPCDLGPRSMVHPYTGEMPAFVDLGPSPGCTPMGVETNSGPANDHRDHVHTPISHRLQILDSDLDPIQHPGAEYFAEAQYIVPQEFVDGNGSQYNNVSYRSIVLAGDPSCGGIYFEDAGVTSMGAPAINAWPGATQSLIEPAPLQDGQAFLSVKTTDLGGGTWHYEYALYNMNLDLALSSLSIPQLPGANVDGVDFYAPLHHAPEPHAENYSNDPWDVSVEENAVTWSAESFSENQLANAVRFGSVYNFWFNADFPPRPVDAMVGLFRAETSILVRTRGPSNAPAAPQGTPLTPSRTRFVSFTVPSSGSSVAGDGETALRVELTSLHHVTPPYAGGPSVPFTQFEGQVRWVGPPSQYVESTSNNIPFRASQLQCTPHYQDWSTVGLLHVTGSAIVPSSMYDVKNVAAICMGVEESCTAVSFPLTIGTSRWGDVETPYNPPSPTVQPDLADVSSLVNKFRGAPGAPIKARALLIGADAFGTIDIAPDFSFIHIAGCVDAFRGRPYPHEIAACP